MRNIKDSPKRLDAAEGLQAMGGELKQWSLVMGR
jgi:uncharacterized protein with GYD domain